MIMTMKKIFNQVIVAICFMLLVLGVNLVGSMTCYNSNSDYTQVQAATKSITVNSANKKTVSALHTALLKGQALTLKVKGNQKSSQKLMDSLIELIKKENKQGVIFHYSFKNTKNGYTYYEVSKENTKLYKYSVAFVKKLYRYERQKYNTETYKKMYKDTITYPNETTRMLRIYYDDLILHLAKTPMDLAWYYEESNKFE